MRIPLLQHLSNRRGPFVTVSVDVTRTDESAAREIELRWQELRRSAAAKGVPEQLLVAIGETLLVVHRPVRAARAVGGGRPGLASPSIWCCRSGRSGTRF